MYTSHEGFGLRHKCEKCFNQNKDGLDNPFWKIECFKLVICHDPRDKDGFYLNKLFTG